MASTDWKLCAGMTSHDMTETLNLSVKGCLLIKLTCAELAIGLSDQWVSKAVLWGPAVLDVELDLRHNRH